MEAKQLIPLGSTISIDKTKIENIIPQKLLDDLPRVIKGKIIDYKMTDGTDIGYVVITENNKRFWIFNNELDYQTKKQYENKDIDTFEILNNQDLFLGENTHEYELNGTRSIRSLTNPINLFNWLIFTLKDIF